MQKKLRLLFRYLLPLAFIFIWWIIFYPREDEKVVALKETSPKAGLFACYAPVPREPLKKALQGDVASMLSQVLTWQKEAHFFKEQSMLGVELFSASDLCEFFLLSYALPEATLEKFFPQTEISATILLACAQDKLVALPKGLGATEALYPFQVTQGYPNSQEAQGEWLFGQNIEVAFTAPYSNPTFISTLKRLHIPIWESTCPKNLEELMWVIEEIAEVARVKERGRLLSLFVKMAFTAIDNRLKALNHVRKSCGSYLYLSGYDQLSLPTENSLSGYFAKRLGLPFSQTYRPMLIEEIYRQSPDALFLASSSEGCVQKLKNFPVFQLEETVQNSPTQFAVLAYRDLAACLMQEVGERCEK